MKIKVHTCIYTLPQKIQPIRIQLSRRIFDGMGRLQVYENYMMDKIH